MAQKDKGSLLTSISDALLLQRAGRGDIEAFEALFYAHYDRVYGLLFRLVGNRGEAEDLTQEVFLKLYQERFAAGREHNVSAWLYRVATNSGYNALRSRHRRWQRNTILLADPTDQPLDPAATVAQRETQRRVRQTLAALSRREVQLLLLRQMGLSYAELAEVCGVAPGSVGTLLRRAADSFRREYRERMKK
ncbi:MAG TPA: sigma-70 family RNA polymerase sigma factor [Candidatus Binatia bacterium]|jgi:RNA polymerase sigma-70 factor (ECF subfamily)|nr:sigma-70 family RNA polymerase sigma factor [Candidatus Binatia bacterium]